MAPLLLALAITLGTQPQPIHFDRIDINHVVKPDGSISFDQLIYWRWSRCERRFVSMGYQVIKDGWRDGKWQGSPMIPRRDGDVYRGEITRHDVAWMVTCDCVIETWSATDAEAVDRVRFPDLVREWE